jgi:hypothetical protein
MHRPLVFSGIFALVLATAGPSLAQTPDFAAADTDKDNAVSLAEANAAGLPWTEDQFLSLDTDANGVLSSEEYANAVKQ